MNKMVIMKDQQAVTTSLQVAENFEKQHKDVLEAIDNKIQSAENPAHYSLMFAEDEYIDSRGRKQRMYFLTKDGFAFIAFGFTGSKADAFKLKYIKAFNEMEDYIKNKLPINNTKLLLRASLEHEEKIDALTVDVSMLKESMRIDGSEEFRIKEAGNRQVIKSLGGYDSNAYRELANKVFARFWRDFKKYFTIPRYGDLPKSNFGEAIEFISEWLPDTETRILIKQANSQTDLNI